MSRSPGSPARRSIRSHWRRLVSWNSSTMIALKRSASRSRISGLSRRSARAASWRSSKSSADSRRFAVAYASAKPSRSCWRRSRSRIASSSSAACSTATLASSKLAERSPRAMSREVEQVVGPRLAGDGIEKRCGAGALQVCRRAVLHQAAGGLAQLLEPLADGRTLAELEDQVAARRAERLVDPGDHPPQAARAVGGQQSSALLVVRAAERSERLVKRLAREDGGLRVVQLAESWVETCFERRCLQQPVAEPVDRRDVGTVQAPGEVRPATAPELSTDPSPQLSGSPLGVGDHEDRLHVEPALAHRLDEAIDEDSGLAGPRAGGDEDPSARIDRRTLLLVRRPAHARLTRHIVQSSHHAGHSPPLGSWTTSPSRIRPAKRRAVSFAPSTCLQKASSSR